MFEGMTVWHWFAITAQIITFAAAVGVALLTALKTSTANKGRLDELSKTVHDHSIQLSALKTLPGITERQFERLDSLSASVNEIKGLMDGMNNTLTLIQRSLIDKSPP